MIFKNFLSSAKLFFKVIKESINQFICLRKNSVIVINHEKQTTRTIFL